MVALHHSEAERWPAMVSWPARCARGSVCPGRRRMTRTNDPNGAGNVWSTPNVITIDLEALDFEKGGGLVSVVVQDATSGAVLLTAFADQEALEETIETGEMHFRSRSRGLWHKGAS